MAQTTGKELDRQILLSAIHFSRSGGTVPTASNTTAAPHLLPPSSTPMATLPQLLSQPQPVAMPQFILTSGQLVQGIQGAQLLIPTSQGEPSVSYVSSRPFSSLSLSLSFSLSKRAFNDTH